MANIITPLHSGSQAVPPRLYEMIKIATLLSRDAEEFSIFLGADKETVRQLKEKSLDESDVEIQHNTSDRARFGEGSYEEWYSKGRTPFTLLAANGALAAFVWLGPKPLGRKSLKYLSEEERSEELQQKEEVWHTLVYRAYPPYRGKGLMTDFVRFALTTYRTYYPDAKLWVGIRMENEGSIALATKLGFMRREDLIDTKKHWLAMTIE